MHSAIISPYCTLSRCDWMGCGYHTWRWESFQLCISKIPLPAGHA